MAYDTENHKYRESARVLDDFLQVLFFKLEIIPRTPEGHSDIMWHFWKLTHSSNPRLLDFLHY